ncbi:MAG: hypothetical protein ABFS10_06355 [Bacteroidota bacterium]
MVKVSTLFHRVDGFDETNLSNRPVELPDQNIETQFLTDLLEPLLFDPGDELVQRVLQRI